MLQLKYPGVYTQELPSGVRTISGAPTSVALFVGPTKAGIDARPIRVLNFGDFERSFGGLSQTSSLSYSVAHFFANGGGEAFVIRVRANNAAASVLALQKDASGGAPSITFTALSTGLSGNDLLIEIDPFGIDANPYGTSPAQDKKLFNLTIINRANGTSERFTRLSTAAGTRFAENVINNAATGSQLVKVAVNAVGAEGPQATGTVYALKALPTGGPFAADIKVSLAVNVRDAAGAAGGTTITLTDVVVFANGAPKPLSVLEMTTKLAAAINAALRADATAGPAMENVAIDVQAFEGGTLLRLRTTPPTAAKLTKRLSDATVTLVAPGTGTSFLSTFFSSATPVVSNPSRYTMGLPYTSSQLASAAVPGADGDANGQPADDAFKQAVMDLSNPDPFFNLLCLPDLVRPAPDDPKALQHANAMTVYGEAALVCENKHAFLLIDPLPNVVDTGTAEAWKSLGFTFQSNHAAAYFPNIRVDDPLEPGSIRSHPPSGAIAGVYARTDARFGVWQAPAGTDASLSGVYGPSIVLSDAEQGILNPIGLNVIRQFPIFGTVSFGSRTIDGADASASDWKYIPVRRTSSYILRSLQEALRWAVHQPNGEQLWSQLRLNVTAFMHGLFRQGAFKGSSARDAYFVLCDSSTTSADDINHGIVNIVIGFAPLKPAEFVVISLRQIVQSAA